MSFPSVDAPLHTIVQQTRHKKIWFQDEKIVCECPANFTS